MACPNCTPNIVPPIRSIMAAGSPPGSGMPASPRSPICPSWAAIASPMAPAMYFATGSTMGFQRGRVRCSQVPRLYTPSSVAGTSNEITGSSHRRATCAAWRSSAVLASVGPGSPGVPDGSGMPGIPV